MVTQACSKATVQSVTGRQLARCRTTGITEPLSRRQSQHRRSRGAATVAQARKGARPKEEEEEGKTEGFLPNLFNLGTGTQRVKTGQPAAKGETGTKRLKPSPRGTQRLQKGQASPAGLLQRLGSQTTRITRKDPNTVFVAGATGRLGLRVVRELLLAGFKVRAGARNSSKAQEYADVAVSLGILPADSAKRLQVVSVDLEDTNTIIAAIGNAGKVVQAIGAAENNVLDFGAPKRIDGDAAINLVNAAVETEAQQFVMVTSLGTGKFGWPAGALNLFGGILVQKRRAEKALEDSGLPYVIVRPGGMERPTDAYKKTNNVRLETRDRLFGGQVSRLQVAELVTAAVANPGLAENKVLEVVAEEDAPRLDYEFLLQQHPSEVSQEERQRQREAEEENRAHLGAAEQKLEDAAEARSEAQRLVQQLQNNLKSKKAAIADVEKEVAPILREAQQVEAELARLREEVERNQKSEEAAKAVLNAAKAAQREGKTLSRDKIRAIEAPILEPASITATGPSQRALQTAPSKQQEALAEEIPKKEIALKLGKAGPQPSAAERKLAEGIAQKEIAVDMGRDEPITARPMERQSFGRRTATPPKQAVKEAERSSLPSIAPSKPAQSPEEVQRLREARAKSAASRAQKEADILARLDAERREEEQEKAQAAAKRTQEARQKAADARRAALAKQEKLQAEQKAEEKKKADAADKQKVQAPQSAQKPKPVAPTAAKETSSTATDNVQEQAGSNAKEARRWIDAWRAEQAGASSALGISRTKTESKTQEGTQQVTGNPSGGFKLPWQQNGDTASNGTAAPQQQGKSKPANTEDANVPSNVQDAREWIRDWRARMLESKLPENSPARK